jgi:hypothetical protein
VIPEIDIWRAAQLMLKRYGDKALDKRSDRTSSQYKLLRRGDVSREPSWQPAQ